MHDEGAAVAEALAAGADGLVLKREIATELFLRTYSRSPRPEELSEAVKRIEQSPNRRAAVEDLLWTLLNSKEFLFNHGEKVALGTCAFVALVLGVTGLLGAMGAGTDKSGKTYAEEFTANAQRVKQSMAGQGAPVLPDNIKTMLDPDSQGSWPEVRSDYAPLPYAYKQVTKGDVKTETVTNHQV